ncbi:AAA domain-containing protein [[Clostridium] fimetarium]|uniref:AAA domain-containing protein n=1 Tax=[Clostridium] fimetarium TaxID=99656 RepID=A0A1I0R1I5_9FIRM|nr:AAA domain-containing protein [[Clostridium] fimetarium]
MKLDLTNEKLFQNNELEISKNVTFVFGKNGAGKSTLTRAIKGQGTDFDVRIFQGFENVIDESKRLNAVVLGEENSTIKKQIDELNKKIESLSSEKIKIQKCLSKPEDEKTNNYWTRYYQSKNKCDAKSKDISDFYKKSAAEIKKKKNPQISSTNFNLRNFEEDITKAEYIQDKDKKIYIQLLKSEPKEAKEVKFPNCDLKGLLVETNGLLIESVEEKIRINRLVNDPEKRLFASQGLNLHKKGDICSFCGSTIQDSVFKELESYFSTDEVKEFMGKIQKKIDEINNYYLLISQVEIVENEFYPEYLDEVLLIKNQVEEKKREYNAILKQFEKALGDKKANLFEASEELNIQLPEDFNSNIKSYSDIKEKNNENKLAEKQEQARNKLRLDVVKSILVEYEYTAKLAELEVLENQRKKDEKDLEDEKFKIIGEGGLDFQISTCRSKIAELQSKTKNEIILADNINKKLRHMVSFELKHCEDEKEKGYYQVKNIKTNETRDITQLSTGEKNIIAF